MKVALVTSLASGGPLEVALMSARALAAAGAEVSAVCTDDATAARFAGRGVPARVVVLHRPPDPRGVRQLRHAVAGVDVVHSHDRRSGFWARSVPGLARQAALVHTVHGLPDDYLPPPIGPRRGPGVWSLARYRWLEGILARRGRLTTPSRALADVLVRRLGVPADRLTVIPHGVELVPASGRHDAIGTLSSLEPVKGVDVFLEAAAALRRAGVDRRVVVFGEGSAAPMLRDRARTLGLHAEFAGFVPAPAALAELAVLAVPSYFENQPMAILEAMAAGVPVVASRVGGVAEIAPDGTAVLVPPGDPEALAHAIGDVLDDPAAASTRVAAARAHIDAHARPALHAERTLAVYHEAIAAGR